MPYAEGHQCGEYRQGREYVADEFFEIARSVEMLECPYLMFQFSDGFFVLGSYCNEGFGHFGRVPVKGNPAAVFNQSVERVFENDGVVVGKCTDFLPHPVVRKQSGRTGQPVNATFNCVSFSFPRG